MPLITKILKPERFNATVLAQMTKTSMGGHYFNISLRVLTDAIQSALDRLMQEGAIG